MTWEAVTQDVGALVNSLACLETSHTAYGGGGFVAGPVGTCLEALVPMLHQGCLNCATAANVGAIQAYR